MKRCPNCRAELGDAVVTCPVCGQSLAANLRAASPEGPAARARRRFPWTIALLTVAVLIVGAGVIWFGARRAAAPETSFEPDLPPAAALESEAQVFVGCVGQTGAAGTFMLSVSRFEEAEPPPTGSPVPRKPTSRAGVPLTGGTPEQPPIAGTGEAPQGGTPVTRVATYVLVGSGGLRMGDHVGQTIEVTGVLDPKEQLEFPRLRVASARPLSAGCSQP